MLSGAATTAARASRHRPCTYRCTQPGAARRSPDNAYHLNADAALTLAHLDEQSVAQATSLSIRNSASPSNASMH